MIAGQGEEHLMNTRDNMPDQEQPITPPPEVEDGIPINVRNKIRESMAASKADAEELERISSRLSAEPPPVTDAPADEEAVIREYEQRYRVNQPFDDGEFLPEVEADEPTQTEKPKRDRFRFDISTSQPRQSLGPKVENTSSNERTWAMLAHASVLLTLFVGVPTGFLASILTIFVPLGIYLYYRDKSDYVAHHALQAFAAQAVGVIGFMILFVTFIAVWAVLLVISGLLIVVLVGIVLFPLVLLGGLLGLFATFLLPLAMLIYSMIASMQAWNGQAYSYPWIGNWVDEQVYNRRESAL